MKKFLLIALIIVCLFPLLGCEKENNDINSSSDSYVDFNDLLSKKNLNLKVNDNTLEIALYDGKVADAIYNMFTKARTFASINLETYGKGISLDLNEDVNLKEINAKVGDVLLLDNNVLCIIVKEKTVLGLKVGGVSIKDALELKEKIAFSEIGVDFIIEKTE